MKCSRCNHNEANIYIEQNVNGESRKYHLCGDCAVAGGGGSDVSVNIAFTDPLQAVHSFWFPPEGQVQKSQTLTAKTCTVCGLSFRSFKKTSLLGCAACYDAFGEELLAVFVKFQPATTHKGKVPKVKGAAFEKDREIAEMRVKLRALIASEEYEEAAKLRDIIRNMESESEAEKGAGGNE